MKIDIINAGPEKVHVNPHFMIIPSNACNASCNYCFGPNRGRIVTPEQFKENIAFIERVVGETGQQKIHITFHGGEPLMAPLEIWETGLQHIIRSFRNHRLKLQIQSNLWNLTDAHCTLFRDYGIEFSTSIDGPEAINDAHRGKGYFARTMRGIDLLRKHNLKVGCIATFSPMNAERYAEVFHFFASQKLSFGVHACLPSITGGTSPFVLSPAQYATLLCNLFDLYIPYRKYVSASSLDQLCKSVVENCGKVCTYKDCSGSFLSVDPEGNVYPCQRFTGNLPYSLGNVQENDLHKRLSDVPAIRGLVQHYKQINAECRECVHLNYCRGGCYYNSMAAGTAKDPYCEAYKTIFDKIRNRLLDEMGSDENKEAIIDKPFNGNGHPLMRKGPVIELTQKPHPVQKAGNAIQIVSLVELSKPQTLDEAWMALKNLGLQVDINNLMTWRNRFKEQHFRLNNCYIHVTFRCQLSCKHCYANAGLDKTECMTVEQITGLLHEARNSQFRQVVFTGGEPLMIDNRDLFLEKLIAIRKELEPLILVLRTNFAMSLSDEEMKKIAGAFHQVVVSIDGNQETHDGRRGKGNYQLTIENVKRYQHIAQSIHRPAELSVACVMTAHEINADPGNAVRIFASENHIRRIRFKPVLPIGKAAEGYPEIVSEALDSYADADEALCHPIKPLRTCGIGHNVYIEPSGNVFPCYAYHKPHSYMGNVFETGLQGILNMEAFRTLARHTVDSNSKCHLCEYRYLCGGACRAWGRNLTQDDLDAPPPECKGLYDKAESIYKVALQYLSVK